MCMQSVGILVRQNLSHSGISLVIVCGPPHGTMVGRVIKLQMAECIDGGITFVMVLGKEMAIRREGGDWFRGR